MVDSAPSPVHPNTTSLRLHIDCPAVPKATKRERQRINRELRREAMRKAEQRRRRWRTARNLAIPIVIVAVIFGVIRLMQDDDEPTSSANANAITCTNEQPSPPKDQRFESPPPMTIDPSKQYTAVMETSCGTITLALDAAQSPVAVNNFVFLSEQKFYDGLDVTRVAQDYVIQSGSPDNTQLGGPGYSVQGELPVVAEGSPAYPVGALAMGKRDGDPPGTAGSQFFIVSGRNSTLPAEYAYVGQVSDGLDVVQRIGSFYPSNGDGPPTRTVAIKTVTIQTADGATTTTTVAP